MQLIKPYIWTSIFLISLFIGFSNNVIFNSGDYFTYYSARENKGENKLNFSFQNHSAIIDINKYKFNAHDVTSPTQIAVGDINNDAYDDFIFTGKTKKSFVSVQINNSGNNFIRNKKIESLIYSTLQSNEVIFNTAIVDIDNNGWNDIVFVHNDTMKSCIDFLLNIEGELFKNKIPQLCTGLDNRNVNLLDVNNDGFIDIYYSGLVSSLERVVFNTPSNGKDGARNTLLLNQNGKFFIDVSEKFKIDDKGITHTSAISDFNQDGYLDILNINDFGYNHFYLNKQGKEFIDNSKNYLTDTSPSYNMSGEVADFNNDGLFDVYVNNANRPTLFLGYNKLLVNKLNHFENQAEHYKVDGCGWAWGARAFEPNQDLNTAVLLVNSPNQTFHNIEKSTVYTTPSFIRTFIRLLNDGKKFAHKNFINTGSFSEYNCLFYKIGNEYINVAKDVGIIDFENGKSIVELDYNNDGISDFIIGNISSSPILYKGIYSGKNRWIGFKLVGKESNKNAIGSTIKIKYANEFKLKQLIPTNGYQSQSTLKFKFGVPENKKITEIEIKWPTGKLQLVKKYELNKYNEIIEE